MNDNIEISLNIREIELICRAVSVYSLDHALTGKELKEYEEISLFFKDLWEEL